MRHFHRYQPGVPLAQPQEKFGRSHESGRKATECVRQRRPLRNRGEGDAGQWHADEESHGDGTDNPRVVDDLRLDPGREHGHRHADDAGHDPVTRGLGIAHPMERENEERRRQDGRKLSDETHHCFLNILSMRSVIMKPLTMLVIDANNATAPRMRQAGDRRP